MNKDIKIVVHTDNTKDTKVVFEKLDEIADLIGLAKIELSMRNRESFMSRVRRGVF